MASYNGKIFETKSFVLKDKTPSIEDILKARGEKMEKNQPEKKFSTGAISATVWKNTREKDGKTFETRSISLDRRYTDKSGDWKSTNSLRLNDIPKARLVLEEAYRYLVLSSQNTPMPTEVTSTAA